MATTETRRMILAAAAACEDKKAEDTRILELDPMDSGFTDFFLVTSGANERQTQAIADEIEFRLKREFHTYPNSVEGRRQGEWVLMDYVDFVVHIFLAEKRAFYDIERLRKSARTIDLAELTTLAQLTATLKEKTAAARAKKAPKKAAKTAPRAAKRASAKKRVVKKAPAVKVLRGRRDAASPPKPKRSNG
jgi:ribosome-associated protein